jgi:hypothetical protein
MFLKKFKCGHEELLEFFQKKGSVRLFKDAKGRIRCQRATCYDCTMEKIRKKRGTKPRLLSDSPIIKSAVRAEKIAAEWFRSRGWAVEHGHGAGPDLVVRFPPDGAVLAHVEVKQAFRGTRCWMVPFVKPSRKADDLIAIVMPNGAVHVEYMRTHLEKCGAYGNRSITKIVKEFGLCFDEV